MELLKAVIEAMIAAGVPERGRRLLCAVSGGPDSMAMLHALHGLSEQRGFTVAAGHVEHGIRQNSGADAEFVRKYCEKMGIPFYMRSVDVPAYAAKHGLSTEAAARQERYRCLEEMLAESGADYIALAHNRDDQAETVLLHLFRGTGMRGLAGMKPLSQNRFRPLLAVSRREIMEYIEENRIPYVLDETNESEEYTRNRIRRTILPAVEAYINKDAAGAIARMADIVREDDAFLESIAKERLDALVERGGEALDASRLILENVALQRRIVRQFLEMRLGIEDVEAVHVSAVLERCVTGRGRVSIPRGGFAEVSCGLLRAGKDVETEPEEPPVPLAIGTTTVWGGMEFSCEYCDAPERFGKGSDLTQYFDGESWPDDAVIRRRRDGDVIWPLGAAGRRKLKDYFIDADVPVWERGGPLVCTGGEVLWAVGHCISDRVKIKDNTVRVIRVCAKK